MALTIKLPKDLTADNNLLSVAHLQIVEGKGVYVTVRRADTGDSIEFLEEGNGEPGAEDRIVRHARKDRRGYTLGRIAAALTDDWQRERLGLPVT